MTGQYVLALIKQKFIFYSFKGKCFKKLCMLFISQNNKIFIIWVSTKLHVCEALNAAAKNEFYLFEGFSY